MINEYGIIFGRVGNGLEIKYTTSGKAVCEFSLADFKIGKHELSAFFRKPGHKNYRECKDQILRNFLNGLQKK